jgi:hypothetical protein
MLNMEKNQVALQRQAARQSRNDEKTVDIVDYGRRPIGFRQLAGEVRSKSVRELADEGPTRCEALAARAS